MDDVALVQRAAALDKDAFGVVYERYATRLYDYLWWVLQDREEATYALYDTFLDAGARLSELADPSKLRPWLFAIASDQALRHQRKMGKADGRPLDNEPTLAAGETDAAWGELKHVVRAIAGDLSPQDRALLDLRYRQGLADDELADAVGVTPERAGDLLERLSGRVEDLLGETVVAFLARQDCPALSELLGPWDDHLDARQREVVEEHAATCATCGERRQRRIPASALLGASPAVAVPGGVGERVLEDVDLTAHHARRWTARRNGFPPPLIGYRHRQRLAIGAAAAAVVLVLAAAAFIVSRGGGSSEVASTGNTTVPTTARSSTSFTTRPPVSTSSLPPLGDPGAAATAGSGLATTPASGAGAGSGGGGTRTGSGGGGTSSATTTPDPAPSDTTPADPAPQDTTPPSTAPPTTRDSEGPAISSLSVSPGTVKAGSSCPNALPSQATVTVRITDPSGVGSVRLTVAGPGAQNVPMTATGGGNYTATVGPFDTVLPPGAKLDGAVIVTATDAAGNQSAKSGSLTISCA